MARGTCWWAWQSAAVGALWLWAGEAGGQVVITEIMFNPNATLVPEDVWEWVEIRNTTALPVDLHGWVLDDDDDSTMGAANIDVANGSTVVPAGGVAVLYNGGDLSFEPSRFSDAWGAGVTLVPVSSFSALATADAIGLWNSHANYAADDLMTTTSPRRSFSRAVTSVNYATTNGFPATSDGRSIAWRGVGSVATGTNWAASSNGAFGAHVSVQTTIPGASINDVADRGTPGVVPGGGATAGLLITEIMYDPASREPDWEWIEVYNNTGALIDFGTMHSVLDDVDGSSLALPNVTSGTIAQGATGVLFNADATDGSTLEEMQAAWGATINFIPVTSWSSLDNGGDTVAIWSSLTDYQDETQFTTTPRRTTSHSAAVVAYDNSAAAGWPTNNDSGSIFMANLTANPTLPASWTRSNNNNSSAPQPVLGEVIDHEGGDVGSPGFVPGVVTTLDGDYSGNGVVDAADYVLWRHALATSTALPHDTTPGSVTSADYDLWRANYGQSAAAGSGVTSVPEPSSGLGAVIIAMFSAAQARFGRAFGRAKGSGPGFRSALT